MKKIDIYRPLSELKKPDDYVIITFEADAKTPRTITYIPASWIPNPELDLADIIEELVHPEDTYEVFTPVPKFPTTQTQPHKKNPYSQN